MPRKVTITLKLPPQGKGKHRQARSLNVVVESLTLGRFRALVFHAVRKIEVAALKAAGPIGWSDWVRALEPEDYELLYQAACPEAPPRQFWPSPRNTQTLLNAIVDTNDMERLLACINLNPDQSKRAGSLDGDIIEICRLFPAATPPVVKGWYMDDFLDCCEGLQALAQQRSGIDLDAPACHPTAAARMPGVQVTVH